MTNCSYIVWQYLYQVYQSTTAESRSIKLNNCHFTVAKLTAISWTHGAGNWGPYISGRHAVYASHFDWLSPMFTNHQSAYIGIQPVKWWKSYCRCLLKGQLFLTIFVGKLFCSVRRCRCFKTFLQRFPINACRDYTWFTVLMNKNKGSSINVWRE